MKSTTEERLIDLMFLGLLVVAVVMSCFDARAEGMKAEDVTNKENDASCLMVPCYVNHDKGGDFDFAPMNKYGHILVDCSCNNKPPKGIYLLGVYYYKCATKEEKSRAISCEQFAFKIKDIK